MMTKKSTLILFFLLLCTCSFGCKSRGADSIASTETNSTSPLRFELDPGHVVEVSNPFLARVPANTLYYYATTSPF